MTSTTTILSRLVLIIMMSLLSSSCFAHVKWFVEFDITDPPKAIFSLTSPLFVILCSLTILGIFVASYIDTLWTKKGHFSFMPYLQGTEYKDLPLSIMRIGTGVFFIILWLIGSMILAPELTTDLSLTASLQLIIAFTVLFRSTLILTGIGILALYVYAALEYGLFHTLDYACFIGLGLFFILTSINNTQLNRYRLPIIYLAIGFSFMWSAIEKIAYPQWFDPFLDKYSFVQMGLDRDFFILSAAFVELALFFMIIRFRNSVAFVALFANTLIISGNIYFGKIDALGHLPANVILLMITVVGNIKPSFKTDRKAIYVALLSAAEFILMTSFILFLYYFVHWLQYE